MHIHTCFKGFLFHNAINHLGLGSKATSSSFMLVNILLPRHSIQSRKEKGMNIFNKY